MLRDINKRMYKENVDGKKKDTQQEKNAISNNFRLLEENMKTIFLILY